MVLISMNLLLDIPFSFKISHAFLFILCPLQLYLLNILVVCIVMHVHLIHTLIVNNVVSINQPSRSAGNEMLQIVLWSQYYSISYHYFFLCYSHYCQCYCFYSFSSTFICILLLSKLRAWCQVDKLLCLLLVLIFIDLQKSNYWKYASYLFDKGAHRAKYSSCTILK